MSVVPAEDEGPLPYGDNTATLDGVHIHVHIHTGNGDGDGDSTSAPEYFATFQGELMSQIDDLRTAIAQVGTDLGEAVARVQAKVTALGDPDPDLSGDLANLADISSQLDDLAADDVVTPPAEEPTDPNPPVDETPVEPTPEVPAEPPVEIDPNTGEPV